MAGTANVDSEKVRGEQLFHSSMTRNMISIKNVHDLADRVVWLIRDAAQSIVPAFGRKGANEATTNTIALAEHLANGSIISETGFFKKGYHDWRRVMDA